MLVFISYVTHAEILVFACGLYCFSFAYSIPYNFVHFVKNSLFHFPAFTHAEILVFARRFYSFSLAHSIPLFDRLEPLHHSFCGDHQATSPKYIFLSLPWGLKGMGLKSVSSSVEI